MPETCQCWARACFTCTTSDQQRCRGLAAKPIIDLMALVTNLADLDLESWRIEGLGYMPYGELGIAGRRYYTLANEEGVRTVQLHCFDANSPHATRHIAFRDYLRAHPTVAKAYEAEKTRARNLHPNDSHAYTEAKSGFIRDVEAVALAWFRESN